MSLADKLALYGISADGAALEKFDTLTRLMLEYNAHTNITGITDKDGIEDKHYVDSLLALKFIPPNAKLCDIGTGAGFPALPIAIMRPDVAVTAIDSVGKKIRFVEQAAHALSLNLTCLNTRAEQHNGQYDIITFRAVSDLKSITRYAFLLKLNGTIIAYKGTEEKAKEEAAEVNGKIFTTQMYPYVLPKGDKRTLVLIKKL